LDSWYENSHRSDSIETLWDEIKPDLLLSTNSFFWEEIPLLAKAKATDTPTFGLVHSWDNLTTKYKLPYKFTKIGLWNEVMFDELKKIYPDYVQDSCEVGVPQFDYYFDIENLGKSREQFLSDVGLDPKLPLISYTTVPDRISKSCFWDVKILLEAIKEGCFGGPINVLVRFHQTGNMKPFDALEEYPNLHVEKPGRMSESLKDLYNPTTEDMYHFADTLRHSQCTINVRSTLSIDASFFDVPIVNPGGDFSPEGKMNDHIRDLYIWEHYLPVMESEGVELAHSVDDYLKAIKRSLDEPGYRKEGRKKLAALFGGYNLGVAGKALAKEVLSLL
jgi:hypothetical protein